jgi:hypothetical protein
LSLAEDVKAKARLPTSTAVKQMGETGQLQFNGVLIPEMDLGDEILTCDLDHPSDRSLCLRDHGIRIQSLGSHAIWQASSPILGTGAANCHPLDALLGLVASRGCTLVRALATNGDDALRTRRWIGKL